MTCEILLVKSHIYWKEIQDANKRTGLNRESLYKMLSEEGNPRLSSLSAIFDALGFKLSFARNQTRLDKNAQALSNFLRSNLYVRNA